MANIPTLKVKSDGTWTSIPAIKGDKGDTGEKGNVNFATFAINPSTGILTMTTTEEYSGANFQITNAYLEVVI